MNYLGKYYKLSDLNNKNIGSNFFLKPLDDLYIADDIITLPILLSTDRIRRFLPSFDFSKKGNSPEEFIHKEILKTRQGLGFSFAIRMNVGLIGMISLETPALNYNNTGFENWTISFCISELFEGKGIMTVALINVFYFLKYELAVDEVYAVTEIDNHRSINIMNKIGLTEMDNSDFKWDPSYSNSKPIIYKMNLLKFQ